MIITIKDILNQMIEKQKIPRPINKGKIYTIPKRQEWAGDMNALRPITLLEAMRKQLTGIMTKKLITITGKPTSQRQQLRIPTRKEYK